MTVGVLDHAGLVDLFKRLEGRRFLGVVNCTDCVELVFSDEGRGPNLVTFWTEGRHRGLISLGGVMDAARYVRDCRRFEDAA